MNFKINELTLDNLDSWPPIVKIAAITVIFIAILFLGYRLDISSKLANLEHERSQEQTLKDSFSSKQHLASNLYAYQEQLKEIQKRFQFLLAQLPTKTEIPGLLEDISKSGIANGLEFRLFKPLPEKQNDFYAELPIEISVIGTFHQLAQFISQIASLDRIVTLHDFNLGFPKDENSNNAQIAGDKKNSSKDKLILSIKAKTYRYLGQNS